MTSETVLCKLGATGTNFLNVIEDTWTAEPGEGL